MRIVTLITFTNSQSQATPSNFQQLIQTTLLYPNGVRFWSPTDGWLHAWLESIQSNSANIWVKIPSSIPASGTYQLYMIQDNTLPMDGVYWGEAPQLSSTYAQYDNGANIFPYYQRWGSLSALPSGWSSISGTVITYSSTYTELAPAQSTGGWYGIYLTPMTSSLSSTPTVWEFYGNMYDSVNAGNYIGTNTGAGNNYNGYAFSEGNSNTNLIYLLNGGSLFDVSTGYFDTNNNKVYTMQMNSPTSLQMFINYAQIYSTTSATSESPTYFDILISNNRGSNPSTPIYIYWLRTRAYPPNGVMPSVSLGAPQYSGELITVTVP